jgi:hypothetical protein
MYGGRHGGKFVGLILFSGKIMKLISTLLLTKNDFVYLFAATKNNYLCTTLRFFDCPGGGIGRRAGLKHQ